jgi:arylsulfatase A-like enzyme
MRWTGWRRWIAAALWLATAACGQPPPDLVLVTLDTLRADHVGPRGVRGESLTPHLDALAARGRVFEHAFTTMPTTAPAHASMLTGLHPREHGIERNGDRGTPEALGAASLQRRLGDHGYSTGAFVTSHVFGGDAMGLGGFDVFDQAPGALRPGADAVAAALAWLEDATRPFFLWVHLYDSHSPYGPAKRKPAHYPVDHARYGWVDRSHYADPAARAEMAELYAAGVQEADAALGVLLAGLERSGSSPLLLVTSDHGELLGERLDEAGFAYGHGSLLGDESLRVPMVLAGPGVSAGRIAVPVSVRDVYTTLLVAAGLPDPGAEVAGRFDLLGTLPSRRVVGAERRAFTATDRLKREIGEDAYAHVRANAVAVSDGDQLLVLGEDGTPTVAGNAPASLRAAGEAALLAQRAARAARPEGELDDATRARLRALGYLE